MKPAGRQDDLNSGSKFWLGLILDVMLAGAIVGLLFLFLKVLPEYRQLQKMEETIAEEFPALTETEQTDDLPSGTANVSFASSSESSTAAEIIPAAMSAAESEKEESSLMGEDTFREKFAEYFSEKQEIRSDGYTSPDISIRITSMTDEKHGSLPFKAYVADIHVSSMENLKAGFPVGHRTDEAEMIAIDNDAVLAVNGDFYVNINKGILVRNGIVLQSEEGTSDICVIYGDGTMHTYGPGEYSAEGILNQNPWQVWSFGPALLGEDGKPKSEYNTSAAIYNRNPRTAIGYYEQGHYCLVVIDGRGQGYSNGASIRTLASFLSDLGCKAAYNLDGGASSVMVFDGQTVNMPSAGGRKISDVIMVCELPTAELIFDEKG